jgi:hypothetical protein
VQQLLAGLDIDQAAYRLGNTQVPGPHNQYSDREREREKESKIKKEKS